LAIDTSEFRLGSIQEDYGSIDLSTVDPNPSLRPVSMAQAITSSLDWINSLGQWGATITSIATRTPTQTNNRGLITGARQPSLLGSSSNSQMLLTVLDRGVNCICSHLICQEKRLTVKTVLTVVAVYLLAVGAAQAISTRSTNSPLADQVAGLPSISAAGGLLNIGLAIVLLVFAHHPGARALLRG
jgi:hypothetical protein